ncbi:AMP-binding protein [Corynebacterium bovis]|uniref:AMP-binding protein n=1 Tax=Corynebacterium bovis TaxID=36808 RepID=UPI0021AB57A3|nr:AMP-binding protein [Corynebacterium bovis]
MSQPQPAVTPGMLPTLAKGTLPLFRSGVLSPMGPVTVGKVLRAIHHWEFLPAGLLAIGAARDPHHAALIDDAGSLTYSELDDQTDRLARALFRSGIRERDRIGMLCRNHRGFVMTLCAHGRLGTDLVLLNTGASAEQTRAVIREQKIDLLVLDEEFIPLLPRDFDACPVIIAWEDTDDDPEAENVSEAADGDHAVRNPDWPSLNEVLRTSPDTQTIPSRPRRGRTVILTSGTTGTPKGARRPEPRTYLLASSIMSRIPLRHHRPYYIAAPMFHTWGFAQIQLALALRATMIVQRRFSPKSAVKLIEANRPHTIAIVPTMLKRLLTAIPEHFNPGVKVIAACGEALPPRVISDTMDAFGAVLYNLYGSTEVSWATIATPEELREHPSTAGKPPMATVVKIVDENGKPCAEGEVGAIYVGNDMLFEGYTRPGADKPVVDGLVATGDLGYVEDGLVYIAGRSDDMIVSGGENVYPQETEDVISVMDGVDEVAVHGVDDEDFGQALAAFVVLADGVDPAEFRERAKQEVKDRLARHCVPRYYVFMDSLPRNEVGKVVPRELPEVTAEDRA